MVSEANEPGSESGKRSDDRRGVPGGTPHKGGASTPLAAPGSFAAAAMVTRTGSLGEPALERAPPALPRPCQRQVDEVADDEALPAHLAEHRERDVIPPRQIPQPAQVPAADRDQHARLALAEEKRVGADAALERDPHAELGAAEAALGERDRQAALGDV